MKFHGATGGRRAGPVGGGTPAGGALHCFVRLPLLLLVASFVPSPPTKLVQAQAQAPPPQQFVSPNMLQAPTFIRSMDSWNVRENTPVGELVYTLEARSEPVAGQDSPRILYDLEETQLFSLADRLSGQVRVAQPIDREQTSDSVSFQVVATPYLLNRPGTPTRLQVTVYILDENDNAPKIERVRVGPRQYDALAPRPPRGQPRPVIRANVSEEAPPESVVIDLIEAVDVDKASSSPLAGLCLGCEPDFRLVPKTAGALNDRLDWAIVVARQLVHVPRANVRQLTVVVSDGKFNSSQPFELTIDDVQNRPPHFVSSTTCVVQENTPLDRTILVLQAVDGDALALDEAPDALVLPPPTNRTSAGPYSGRQIVYDFYEPTSDSSSSQHANFKLHPLTGQLQVANRLDREDYLDQATSGVLFLQVRARELFVDAETAAVVADDLYESILSKLANFIDRSEGATTLAEVSVIVVDANDNPPRWLNATEIRQLSRRQQQPGPGPAPWQQSLPRDRHDTGRNYHFRVRENSPPGSPLTTRDEMFVYDLDNGDNAEFNLTLEDPFHLFEVEPKRVSGFASVTLKLASGAGHKRQLLDYENMSARSYIIQLFAEETKSHERLRSKAQIQVDLVDVNDNAPEFKEPAYLANIREDAPPGKAVKLVAATDRDGVSKQLRYSLHGHSAHLFDLNPTSGLITVAKCQQADPPAAPHGASRRSQQPARPLGCIDFEQQQRHDLMVEASDGELATKVPLTVFVEDALDNGPVFALPIVDVVIEEGAQRLEPPIRIEATDEDQTSTLSYSIVEGNFEGFFAINNATGELQLTRAIRVPHDDLSASSSSHPAPAEHPQQLSNKMTLIVQATDGLHAANGTIRVDILDANDNAPQFSRASYEKELSETAAPGQSVITVRAFDLDRGNNARVSYRLERGSFNQFEINESTGEISLARPPARPLDAAKRDSYTLEVVAYDHGLVSKSSSVLVQLRVVGARRRAPHFAPQVQRKTVNESTLNNTVIHRMTLAEPDGQPQGHGPQQALAPFQAPDAQTLTFEPGPIEGLDKLGQPVVELERLESMFSVSTNTGDVMVSSGLDHDFAAHVNLTVYVSYSGARAAGPAHYEPNASSLLGAPDEFRPRSVGYLVISVLDDNEHAPEFAAPWTAHHPELTFQMLEELPVGSRLAQLAASDADSPISHFEIEPPNEYFELTSPQSGVLVNKKLIDYDTLMRQTFLSPGAHRAGGELVQQQQQGGGNNLIQFNVLVYDSGLRQLSAKAIVSVEILPINDHECRFEQRLYEVHLRENALPDTVVAQVRATDLDFGEQHSSVSYQLLGDQRDLFAIDPRTGVVTVSQRGSVGLDREQLAQPVVSLTVLGRDDQPAGPRPARPRDQTAAAVGGRTCTTTLRVHLDDVNDNPALFAQKVYDVIAYDTDAVNVPLAKLIVHDEDAKHTKPNATGAATTPLAGANSFRILSGNLNDSFNVTQSGMLYATRPLNGTAHHDEPIQLRVQVRQHTGPSQADAAAGAIPTLFTDECLVRVHVMKINRHAPEWRLETAVKGAVAVEENARPGTLVAQLRCVDRDHEPPARPPPGDEAPPSSSPIRYWIKENGANVLETGEFRLDPLTGNLITRVQLDRERRALYQLVVACEDNGRPQSLESLTSLYVTVLDVDDNKPEFLVARSRQVAGPAAGPRAPVSSQQQQQTILFLVEEQQSKGLQVGELKAIDRDLDSRIPTTYCLLEGNEYQEFLLDQATGVLYTNQTLDRERQAAYDLLVRALNDGQTCDEYLAATGAPLALQASANASAPTHRRVPQEANQDKSLVRVRVELQDINDNAPTFGRPTFRAGVHHRSLLNTLVTQVAAQDPDHGANGSLSYRISEILLYKTNPPTPGDRQRPPAELSHTHGHHGHHHHHAQPLSKPIKLIQSPFKVDQQGNIYTQQLLTQYQLMSVFVLHIEATEMAEPWRTAVTKLEVYLYETNSQLKIRINLHPRLIDAHRLEVESLLSNATKLTAIINRARAYNGGGHQQTDKVSPPRGHGAPSKVAPAATVDLTGGGQEPADEPNFANIHAIFVENYRLVSPNLVMEKFDLTSAQLLFAQQLGAKQLANLTGSSQPSSAAPEQEFSSLIDKIALASIQSAEYHAGGGPSSPAVDWLESPPMLLVCLCSMLTLIGLLICATGCCCTSRIKDHIIKTAMDKLVKQQTLQAKINERVLAATNQAYAGSALGSALGSGGAAGAGQQQHHHQSLANMSSGHDFIMQQAGGFMSSFDATKGCLDNNYENMSILQRAMEAGEFIDPNYTTLANSGHLNLGAHYYDPSQLEGAAPQLQAGDEADEQPHYQVAGKQYQINGGALDNSVVSLSLDDENDDDDQEGEQDAMAGGNTLELTQAHLMGAKAPTKVYTNGANGVVSSNSRMRQQIPNNGRDEQ